MDGNDAGECRNLNHRGKIFYHVVRQFLVEAHADRLRYSRQQQRITVRRRFRDELRADVTAAAGAIFHHHGFAQPLGESLADKSREQIGGTAGSERNDDANWLIRIILCRREHRQGSQDKANNATNGGGHELLRIIQVRVAQAPRP